MLPEIGQKFGPYEILGKLGSGGMGVVFRAWDDRLHREVAVKLLHQEFQAPGMRQRFLLEARAASALSHPHICTIFDIGEQDGEPYLVMELLEGITLKERIAHSACSSEEIVRYGGEIAEALVAAVDKGIVHRDIKPANIFLQGKTGGARQVKVLDFGLAKVSMALRSGRDSRALELTSAGSTVGTLAYMSPEQARGESLDARSDLFSLGIVMYEMATRRIPFRGATTALAFQSLLIEQPDPIRTWNVSVPRELERIINRLLTKDRSERYQTAREVVSALHKLAARSDGDWLRKLPRPDVPLVPATDPIVPRKTRPLRLRPEPIAEPISKPEEEKATTQATSEPDFLRPKRLPLRESQPRDVSIGAATEGSPGMKRESRQSRESGGPRERGGVEPQTGTTASEAAAQPVSRREEDKADLPEPRKATADAALVVGPPSAEPIASLSAAAEALSTESGAELMPGSKADPLDAGGPSAGSVSTPDTPSANARVRQDDGISDPRRSSHPRVRLAKGEQAAAAEEAERTILPAPPQSTQRLWLYSVLALAAVLGAVAFFLTRADTFAQIVLAPKDTILIAPILNRTGDESLADVVQSGLEIELEQRSNLHWLGMAAMRAGLHKAAVKEEVASGSETARTAAKEVGARAYLYGELSKTDGGYDVRLDVIDVASNDRLGSVQETATGLQELPSAISRLSVKLRAKLGEATSGGNVLPPTPLSLQATGTMAALSSFAQAENAAADGDMARATDLYERAVVMAPAFTLAHLRLAWLYERDGAELAAAQSATRALASASRAGTRVNALAQITAAMLVDREPAHASQIARQYLQARPQDMEVQTLLARSLRSQGHMTEALLTAEQGNRSHPFLAQGYVEVAYALLGLDRYKDAAAIAQQAKDAGVVCECGARLQRYLSGQPDTATAKEGSELDAIWQRGLMLDDSGQFAEGLATWKAGAELARGNAATSSAAAAMLAQAAVDRALGDHCDGVPGLLTEASLVPYGRTAAFHLALSEALCMKPVADSPFEDRMSHGAHLYSVPVMVMLPLLRGARALAGKRPAEAIALMSEVATERDAPPLAAYLHAMARQQAAQDRDAATEFDAVAQRRGYALLAGSTVAPLAERSLYEVFQAENDAASAAQARARFQSLWHGGDVPVASKKKTAARSR